MLKRFSEDISRVLHSDPAATSRLFVALFWPGLHAVWAHRLAHWLWSQGWKLPAHAVAYASRALTGIEIHPGARIGRRLFIDHGSGVVIGETAIVGDDVTIYHGVTLGGVSSTRSQRHPTVENDVVIGAGAKVLGNIRIGSGSRIGANAVVVRNVAPERVVVGIPGRAIERHNGSHPYPDLQHDQLPDVVESQLRNILQRLDWLEFQTSIDLEEIPEPEYYL